MAISQFSYSALASYRIRGEQLRVEGSFDSEGKLTRDSAAIETQNGRDNLEHGVPVEVRSGAKCKSCSGAHQA